MQLEQFRHRTPITVRFADVDMLGHVNNAKYVTYLEEARLFYAREVFRTSDDSRHVGMILARTVIDYLLPLYEGENVEVWTRCSRVGRKSFDLSYLIVKQGSEELASMAVTTMVAYDYEQRVSMMLSEQWRQRILAYEKVAPEQK